jgi:Mn-containing catalase
MDENQIVSPDEAKAEQEALAEAKAEEVRAKVVADLGLTDDDNNKPVIDKLVERELAHRRKLSEAIGQKIKYRDAANKKPPQSTQTGAKPLDEETIRKQAAEATREALDQEYLDEKQYPDEVVAEIKSYAKYRGISARQAEKAPHIKAMIDGAIAEGKIVEAALPRTQTTVQARTQTKFDPTKPEFDMSTEEGRKAYHESKKARHGQK